MYIFVLRGLYITCINNKEKKLIVVHLLYIILCIRLCVYTVNRRERFTFDHFIRKRRSYRRSNTHRLRIIFSEIMIIIIINVYPSEPSLNKLRSPERIFPQWARDPIDFPVVVVVVSISKNNCENTFKNQIHVELYTFTTNIAYSPHVCPHRSRFPC